MTWLQYAIVAAVACITTMALVPPVKRLAFKIDAVDYPSERRVNKQPTARFGGVAMFGGLLCGLAVIIGGVAFFDWHFPLHSFVTREISYPGIFAGITLAFLVGVADDIFDLRPMHKFLGQVIAATIVAASGLLLTDMMNPFGHEQLMFGWLSCPITVFYLVAFCNVINLIDGLDGLAAGITAISSAAMVVFAILTVRPEAAFFGLALVGVCAGFLRYNFHPASIFMGDSGSILLGMSLGVVSLFATTKSTLFVSLLMPIIVAGVPVIDTAAAIIRRKRQHQSVMQADRGHIHHRLLSEGYSQRSTVLIMWGWTAILSVSALFITEMHGLARLPFVCLALGVSAFFVIKLNLLGPVLQHHYNPRPSTGKKRINEQFNAVSGNASSPSHTDESPDEQP